MIPEIILTLSVYITITDILFRTNAGRALLFDFTVQSYEKFSNYKYQITFLCGY